MARLYVVLVLLLLFCFEQVQSDDEANAECKDQSDGCFVAVADDFTGRMIEDHNVSVIEESRKSGGQSSGSKGGKQQKGIMERLLPMMIVPFMISTGMIPMMLVSLKMMMLKSALIGKIAIILLLINMFRNRSNRGGVLTHNIRAGGGDHGEDKNDWVMQEHYGYQGEAEYGAYVSKRRRRRKRQISD